MSVGLAGKPGSGEGVKARIPGETGWHEAKHEGNPLDVCGRPVALRKAGLSHSRPAATATTPVW
jgi:hypothetical protein